MERNHLEDLVIDRRIMLKGMLMKYHGSAWTGLIYGSGQGQVAGSCEHNYEPSGSIKCE